jgi:hypothetical protein
VSSRLRPGLPTADPCTPTLRGGTALYSILGAVESQPGLVHGQLHWRGAHCAIGAFFHVNPHVALPSDLIDEVAAVNDSVPHLTHAQRRTFVARWLRWRLTGLGVPGFRTQTDPRG